MAEALKKINMSSEVDNYEEDDQDDDDEDQVVLGEVPILSHQIAPGVKKSTLSTGDYQSSSLVPSQKSIP